LENIGLEWIILNFSPPLLLLDTNKEFSAQVKKKI